MKKLMPHIARFSRQCGNAELNKRTRMHRYTHTAKFDHRTYGLYIDVGGVVGVG